MLRERDSLLFVGALIFITGTDTGVGKTLLTAMLLEHLRAMGACAFAVKPVCAGSLADVHLLHRIQKGELSMKRLNPYFFPEPVAPGAIPRNRRQRIGLPALVKSIRNVQAECDFLLVEGCGGLMVPLGSKLMVRDLIAALGCPVILVARNRLGVINHTLLSVDCLNELTLPDGVVVLMNGKSETLAAQTNPGILRRLSAPMRLYRIPYLGPRPMSARAIKINAKRLKKTLALMTKMDSF